MQQIAQPPSAPERLWRAVGENTRKSLQAPLLLTYTYVVRRQVTEPLGLIN